MATATEVKHTPGPWIVNGSAVEQDTDGMTSVICYVEREHNDAWDANGKLLAAATKLLEACQLWIRHYDEYVREQAIGDEPGIAEMRAAIAAATK